MKTYLKGIKTVAVIFLSLALFSCQDEQIETINTFTESDQNMLRPGQGLDNRTVIVEGNEWDYWLPVECGSFEDYLTGSATSTSLTHYKDGVEVWNRWQSVSIEATSSVTGETFVFHETSYTYADDGLTHFRFTGVGDAGTRYTGYGTWNPGTEVTDIIRFVCAGRN
jgi:hypothetical protein